MWWRRGAVCGRLGRYASAMGLFTRWRRAGRTTPLPESAPEKGRDRERATMAHLGDFVATRVGVEAYVEPQTNVTQTTVMFIATDGEWTRRRVPDAKTAYEIARTLGIPVYDVQRTGYPQRMRDWNTRQRIERQRRRGQA